MGLQKWMLEGQSRYKSPLDIFQIQCLNGLYVLIYGKDGHYELHRYEDLDDWANDIKLIETLGFERHNFTYRCPDRSNRFPHASATTA